MGELGQGIFDVTFEDEQGPEVEELFEKISELMFDKIHSALYSFVDAPVDLVTICGNNEENVKTALNLFNSKRAKPDSDLPSSQDQPTLFSTLLGSLFPDMQAAKNFVTLRSKYMVKLIQETLTGEDRVSVEDYQLTAFSVNNSFSERFEKEETAFGNKELTS